MVAAAPAVGPRVRHGCWRLLRRICIVWCRTCTRLRPLKAVLDCAQPCRGAQASDLNGQVRSLGLNHAVRHLLLCACWSRCRRRRETTWHRVRGLPLRACRAAQTPECPALRAALRRRRCNLACVRNRSKLLILLPCLGNQRGPLAATKLHLLAVDRDARLQPLLLKSPPVRVLGRQGVSSQMGDRNARALLTCRRGRAQRSVSELGQSCVMELAEALGVSGMQCESRDCARLLRRRRAQMP